ncbi:MAG: redoxin domain-containing protein [Natronomonas sp.]
MVTEGESAPDFELQGAHDGEIGSFRLSEFLEGRPVVLTFYIHDFSPICTEQVCELNDMEFLTFNDDVAVLGISLDGPWSHRQYAAEEDVSYPLLSDTNKQVYRDYGMIEQTASSELEPRRGIVVVDTDETVRYRWVADDNWDSWNIEPLHEANDVINEII